ncbi:MAG: hypothetical protein JM58_06950 [Peptococcaceae bacterium BICA1-8]|nr:MAG: hypothetical protein JM58_06950 [Peptococcaceae bacterium BICA1-8]
MEKIKAGLFYTLGSVYLSRKLLDNPEPKILHISDTPAVLYSQLKKIIKKIQPEYIIHTGDLVDNIKLSIYPSRIDEYTKGARDLIEILESSSAKEIHITLGNHDNKNIVCNLIKRSTIYEKNAVINIENIHLKISHYSNDSIISPSRFNLFGHDISLGSQIINGKVFLNGIQSINIIALNSKKVFSLPYPIGTNESRLGKFKIGM